MGSRHLQALAKIEFPVKIWVVDPNSDSLKTGKKSIEDYWSEIIILKDRFINLLIKYDKKTSNIFNIQKGETAPGKTPKL